MEGAWLYSTGRYFQRERRIDHYRTAPAECPRPLALTVGKSIDSLSAQELADFRRTIAQALALNDKRGIDYFASCRGVPFGWCQQHDPLFRPWHRAYLYWLDLALQS